ncbi:MAG TPA: hypothetical protein VJ437_10315 [Acidiferrobacterales bacterium]|nr:hypothetical protein [Acidiferrobacterales bacterium]
MSEFLVKGLLAVIPQAGRLEWIDDRVAHDPEVVCKTEGDIW